MIGVLLNFIRSIDFISSEVQLRTFGQTRFKTVFGGIISFGMFGVVVVLTLYFFKVLLYRRLVSTSGMDITNLQPILFGVSDLIQFEFVNDKGEPIPDWEDYLEIKAYLVQDESETLLGNKFSYYEVGLSSCGSHDIQHDFSGDTEFFNKDFLCFDNKNIHIYGSIGQNLRSKYLSVKILKKQAIVKDLSSTFFVIKYLDYEFDHFNSTSGKQSYLRYDSYSFEEDESFQVVYKYKKTIYQNDLNWFYFDGIDDHFFMIVKDIEKLTKFDQNQLYEFQFMMSSLQTINHRYYTKLQDALSNIGGLLEIFIFFFSNIQHYLTERLNYLSIANQIINFGSAGEENHSQGGNGINKIKTLKFYEEESKEKPQSGIDDNNGTSKSIIKCDDQTPTNNGFLQQKNVSNKINPVNNVNSNQLNSGSGFNNIGGSHFNTEASGSKGKSSRHLFQQNRSDMMNMNNFIRIPQDSTKQRSSYARGRMSVCFPTIPSRLQLKMSSQLQNNANGGEQKKKGKFFNSLFAVKEKQKNGRFRLQNKEQQITLTLKEFLCDRFCFRKSHRINLISKAAKYIDEKVSIEFILKKLNEIDKLKFVIFDRDQLNLFHIIPNPDFNEIFGDHSTKKLRELDNLWRVYEFYQPNEKIENASYNKIAQSEKKSFKNNQLINFLSDHAIEAIEEVKE